MNAPITMSAGLEAKIRAARTPYVRSAMAEIDALRARLTAVESAYADAVRALRKCTRAAERAQEATTEADYNIVDDKRAQQAVERAYEDGLRGVLVAATPVLSSVLAQQVADTPQEGADHA